MLDQVSDMLLFIIIVVVISIIILTKVFIRKLWLY